jgi:hypothetical protein
LGASAAPGNLRAVALDLDGVVGNATARGKPRVFLMALEYFDAVALTDTP